MDIIETPGFIPSERCSDEALANTGNTSFSNSLFTLVANLPLSIYRFLFSSHKVVIKTISPYDQRKSYWLYHWWPANLQLPDSTICVNDSTKSSATDCGAVGIKTDFLFPLPQSGEQLNSSSRLLTKCLKSINQIISSKHLKHKYILLCLTYARLPEKNIVEYLIGGFFHKTLAF